MKLLDTNLWVDFFRKKTPPAVKAAIMPWIIHEDACLCGPVSYEALRDSSKDERRVIQAQFASFPSLDSPATLWQDATENAHHLRGHGITIGALDLLIATLAIHHRAELVTFDTDFAPLPDILPLNLRLLTRPS